MKALKFVFIILMAVCCALLIACQKETTALNAPDNLTVSNKTLFWDPVENADCYCVYINYKEYYVQDNRFDLSDLQTPGDYEIEVSAISKKQGFEDSIVVQYVYTINKPLALNTPGNLKLGNYMLFWDPVENADCYCVYINYNEYYTQDSYFDLSDLQTPGDYDIKVSAISKKTEFEDSDTAQYTYTFNNDTTPTPGLEYTLTEDGKGYEVSRGKADLNGKIIIPDYHNGLPVTKIADYAFQLSEQPTIYNATLVGCNTETKSVRLPKYLKEIGNYAFGFNLTLKEINIPDSVEIIGKQAFVFTQSLQNIKLPAALKTLGESAFAFSAIRLTTIPQALTIIGDYAFTACTRLSQINFTGKIQSIGCIAFNRTPWYNNFPDDFVVIDGILLGYKGNQTIINNLPANVKQIAGEAFADVDFSINNSSVRYIRDNQIESIVIPDGVKLGKRIFKSNKKIQSVILPQDLTAITAETFYYCMQLKSVNIPDKVKIIERSAFSHSGIGAADLSSVEKIEENAFSFCGRLQEVILPSTLTSIEDNTFYECTKLKSITLPDTLTYIGEKAFYWCGLESITIPDGITELSSQTFSLCKKLTEVKLPSALKVIGEKCFYSAIKLNNVILPEGLTEIRDHAFSACEELTKIVIPDTVTDLGVSVFQNCKNLTEATLPSSLTEIPVTTFSGCSALTNINIPENVTVIGGNAFYKCTALNNVILPNNLAELQGFTFFGCTALTSIVLPSSLETIGKKVFYGCTALTSIVLPSSLKTIGEQVFYGCTALTEITIPTALSESILKIIENCSALDTIYYSGTLQNWYENVPAEVQAKIPEDIIVYFTDGNLFCN